MSKLEFVGSRAPGHSSLHRRSSPGPRFTFIASLPNRTAEAVRQGGTLRVTLNERARRGHKPWRLDVVLDDKAHKGCSISHDQLLTLIAEPDRIPVRVEEGAVAFRKYELLQAEHALRRSRQATDRARAAVQRAEARVTDLQAELMRASGPENEVRIGTSDGRYEVVLIGDEDAFATRHGEAWRDLTDAPLTVAVARDLQSCRDTLLALGGDPMAQGAPPAHYGPDRDLLRLTLTDGSELVQDAEGRFYATTRDGDEVSGMSGDKLALTLAYELEGARAALAELAMRVTTHPARPDPDEAPSPLCEF
jgi:hypothetical protein